MNKMKIEEILLNINHIIKISYCNHHSYSGSVHWVDEQVKVKKRWFRPDVEETIPGHYEDYDGQVNIHRFVERDKLRYKLVKNPSIYDMNYFGDIWMKAFIKVETIAGKYTNEEVIYYDDYDELLITIDKLKSRLGVSFISL